MATSAKFLYDGDCAFCQRCAQFLRRYAPSTVQVVPWQSQDLTVLGVGVTQCEYAVQWVALGEPVAAGPDAIARLFAVSPSRLWRTVGTVLSWRAVRWLAWPVYRFIARNRHRMPAGTRECGLSQP